MAKISLLTATIQPGCLVEFMQGDQPQLAWVLENNAGKCRALTINKREIKLTAARILPWTGPCLKAEASRQEMLDALNEHHAKRGELQASIDIMEVWELAQGELETADISWFAELLWDKPGADEKAAMGRAILAAKTHFKFRPPRFDIYPEETVTAKLQLQAEQKARDEVVSSGNELFRQLWNQGRPPAHLSLDKDTATRLEELLRIQIAGNGDEKANKLWNACRKGLPEHPHQALRLARAWGVVDAHHNHLLDEAGYVFRDADWTPAHQAEIDAHLASFKERVQPPEETPFLSIDGATTRDIDDAFHIEKTEQGYHLAIALARPTLTWEFDSPLDRAVFNRATSIYLPEGTSHMLPEALGLQCYSLTEGDARPALVVDMELDQNGNILTTAPRLAWIRTERNVTYDTAEGAIANEDDDAICLASTLAEKLFARRLENGASVINRDDVNLTLHTENGVTTVALKEKPATPKSALLVSEFMILTTSALAVWAGANNVPLLHRTQAIALPSEAQGVFSRPEEIFKVVKLLAPAILELKPKRHAALGVDAYAPITSPIRRYTDLINSSQIQHFLESGSPRLDEEQLAHLAPLLSSRLGSSGQIQRFRPRYWKLLYLAQHKKQNFEAVVVDENGPYPSLALADLQINLRVPRKMLGDKIFAGQLFALRMGRIDPLTNELKVAEALEM